MKQEGIQKKQADMLKQTHTEKPIGKKAVKYIFKLINRIKKYTKSLQRENL